MTSATTLPITVEDIRQEADRWDQVEVNSDHRHCRPRLAFPRRTFSLCHADGLTPAGSMYRKIQLLPISLRAPTESILLDLAQVNQEVFHRAWLPKMEPLLVIASSRLRTADSLIQDSKSCIPTSFLKQILNLYI